MKRFALPLGLALLCTPLCAETAADRLDLHRGLNFEIWVEWLSTEEMVASPDFLTLYPDWRRHVSAAELASVKAAGFDFARLPMDPAPLLRIGPGPRQDQTDPRHRRQPARSAGLWA
jgi:endoglucanase